MGNRPKRPALQKAPQVEYFVKVDAKLAADLQICYGFWTKIAKMMQKIEFLKLQSISKYAYSRTIGKVQTRWSVKRDCYFAIAYLQDKKFIRAIVANTYRQILVEYQRPKEFESFQSIQVQADLFYFYHSEGQIRRVSNFDWDGKVKTQELKARFTQHLNGFQLSKYQGTFIYITGGRNPINPVRSVLVYDTSSDSIDKNQPELNIARCKHSSAIVGNKLFIFGGIDQDYYQLDSLELLDLTYSKEDRVWDLIRLQGITARSDAIMSSVGNDQILIIGGLFSNKSLSDAYLFSINDHAVAQITSDCGTAHYA